LSSKKIDLIVYDFDGVMTDNKVFVFEKGLEAVRCCRADGLGINMIKKLGMDQIIISTESNPVVEVRAKKIDIPVIYNCENKLLALELYCEQNNLDKARVLYVGNDINDLDVMNAVGIPVCPSDAHPSILKIASIALETKGGDGVVRELAEKFEY
jgi:3-deoxy-D-manno-octulosonate 8-phosphate phosphatase (KDO 8-P phosphatase)